MSSQILKTYHLFLILGILGFGSALQAQSNKIDTTKYRINLPSHWKAGNRIWQKLDEKLPLVSEELKDKQLCGDDCKPKYTLEFEMSEPVIVDHQSNHLFTTNNSAKWQFVVFYRFSASLLMFNEKDSLITRFILVDKDEIWKTNHVAYLHSNTNYNYNRMRVNDPRAVNNPRLYANDLQNQQTSNRGYSENPSSYFTKNKDKILPTQRDMLNVIDEKVLSW